MRWFAMELRSMTLRGARDLTGAARVEDALPTDRLQTVTDAIVEVHEAEKAAFLRGEFEANVWRPEVYAEAAIEALDDAEHRTRKGKC